MTQKKNNYDLIRGAIYGQIVGDAIGVPVEMVSRYDLMVDPIDGMTGGADTAHKLPPGHWSDDGAMTLALIDSLNNVPTIDLSDIADKFVGWLHRGHYTPDDVAFGSGGTTRAAIEKFLKTRDTNCGGTGYSNNGNGSLMRILPLAFFLNQDYIVPEDRYEAIKGVSSLTHAHNISIISCYYLVAFAQALANGFTKEEAYNACRLYVISDLAEASGDELSKTNLSWIDPFKRLLYGDIAELPEDKINSGFFVVETLEAAIWCIMNTDDFESAVLTAVNMGGDSDSTAAVVGGLAGLIYGFDDIPAAWLNELPKGDWLEEVIDAFAETYQQDLD